MQTEIYSTSSGFLLDSCRIDAKGNVRAAGENDSMFARRGHERMLVCPCGWECGLAFRWIQRTHQEGDLDRHDNHAEQRRSVNKPPAHQN
jgi:hypothetical protein